MKPYIVRISSFKGGVGKTTIAVNLSVALQSMGYETLLIDADTTNPAVGIHTGMSGSNIGTKELLSGKSSLAQVTSVHGASGLHVITGSLNQSPYFPGQTWIAHGYTEMSRSRYQFVIVDSAPGFTPVQLGKFVDEAIIVSTPDIPSLTSAVKLEAFYNKHKMNHKLIVNRVDNKRYEVHPKEISEIYEGSILGFLPEHEIVPKSIGAHIPAMMLDRRCTFSKAVLEVARRYAVNTADLGMVAPQRRSLLNRLSGAFGRRN